MFLVLRAKYGTLCNNKNYESDQSSLPDKMNRLQSLQSNGLAAKYKNRKFVMNYLDGQRNSAVFKRMVET